MSKKRKTKAQKIAVAKKRQQKKINRKLKKTKKTQQDLLIVPEKYIKKDLIQTLIVSLIFLAVIFALWKYFS